jgi:LPS-assembly lipoprotein
LSPDTRLAVSRRALILGALALGGCGFRPVYGSGGAASTYRNAVGIETPDTVEGYALRARLEDRLGRSDSPAYRLNVTVTVGTEAVAIAADETATRVNLPGVASFSFTDGADQVLAEGEVSSFTSYSTSSTTVATRAAEADARERLMTILADMIVTRLMAAAVANGG